MWAPVLSRVLGLRDLSSWEESFDAATCPTAQGSAFLRGELWCSHVSHGLRWAVDHRNKERLSYSTHAARLAYFQGLLVRYWITCRRACRYSASLQRSIGRADHSWTWLQWWYDPTIRHYGTGHVQCSRAIRWDDSMLLASYKISFATPSCYDLRWCIAFQPSRGQLSGPRSQCNCLTLSYKRLG
jgi:hypothetical protein